MPLATDFALVDTPISKLARAEFGGIQFPYVRRTLEGGTRFHVHEYIKVPGGRIEKNGRKPYIIRLTPFFHDLPGSRLNQLYPGMYPQALHNLRTLFEEESTEDLVVPGVGKMRAYCTNWTQDLDVLIQSGESAQLVFIEDQEEAFAAETRFEFAADDLDAKLSTFNEQAEIAKYRLLDELPEPGIFDSIREAVGSVQAVRDQIERNALMVESKLREVESLCREADKTVDAFQNPENHLLLDAMKDLWAAAAELAKDVQGKRSPIGIYTVPKVMAVSDIASTLYGDATRTSDLLALNDFPDVLYIQPGTPVRYYQGT